jgi:hypothetical protein
MTVVAGSGQYTTFVARMLLLPVTLAGGAREEWPLMVVNPGLECAHLERSGDGSWQVSPDRALVQAGLGRLRPGLPLGVPSDGLVARLTDSTVAVVLQAPPFTVYEAPADEQLLGQARALGGVLFAVTPTLNPGDLDAAELRPALGDARTVGGWAALHAGTPAAAAVPAPPADLGAALEPRPPVDRQADPPRTPEADRRAGTATTRPASGT